MCGDVIHPRHAVELQVERGFGGIGGAVHVQQDPFRRHRELLRPFVADIELDSRRVGRDGDVFGDEIRHFRPDAFVTGGRGRGPQACQNCGEQEFAGSGLQVDLLECALAAPADTVTKAASGVTLLAAWKI